ncbi:MAG: tRNA (N6-isopentenyl adenosine(37)-C2)-methylthiotransferase MiaB [Bacteroidia bacterium]|nr:tRNA (N6-isopentenyl adenosine(37)-C2)-methylthiotransferase MiaB [Bacteroidia bacterium]
MAKGQFSGALVEQLEEKRQGEAMQGNGVANAKAKLLYLESYGCAMNFNDSEIVASILKKEGYEITPLMHDAHLILVNTCSIRERAEQTVRNRLRQFSRIKKNKPGTVIGLLGCMAERLKEKLLEQEKLVDIVVGPDAYRELPKLIDECNGGQKSVNVLLSLEETYADISPVRLGTNGVTAFVSIMRGCDNMCSFCVVPYTRGRERSRNPETIVQEAKDMFDKGFREVTLLGQNVDSYLWFGGGPKKEFEKLTKEEQESSVNFAQLLELVAKVSPDLRIRFSTSHPKDITDDVLYAIKNHKNICNYIHLPMQSGSSPVLKRMNRTYDREWYLSKIDAIKTIIPDCAVSTDIITGFCGETDEDHKNTMGVLDYTQFEFVYQFKYSERPGTLAARQYEDDVPEEIKTQRLNELIKKQSEMSYNSNLKDIGRTFEVLVEGTSKRSEEQLYGRNSQNKVIVFPKADYKPGDYTTVKVTDCTAGTLIGELA